MFEKTMRFLWIIKDVEEKSWGGLLWIGERDSDYVLWWTKSEIKEALVKKYKSGKEENRELIYEYDQGAQYETRNWCTIYSAITELSYLMDRKFSLCEILEIGRKMVKDWKLDPNKWAYLSDAIDAVRHYWNDTNPEKPIESYRISYTDEVITRVLDEFVIRPTQLWYRTSSELSTETRLKPYIATKKTYRKVWGHAVTRFKWEIINNYSRPNKVNRFRFAYMQELIADWVVFNNGYLFLKK